MKRDEDFSVIEAISLLTPYDVDKTKVRVGPRKDGGYIYLAELLKDQPVFSYGIDVEYRFDAEMAAKGHQIYMFDHTIDGINNPDNNPLLHWVKEGVDGKPNAANLLGTMEEQIERYAPNAPDLILKMDIEGFEFAALNALPDNLLLRFSQICFEIHNLHLLEDADFRYQYVKLMRRLTEKFTLFHVHANNFDGDSAFHYVSGVPISTLLELSFVRSDLVSRSANTTLYPTELDYPNVFPKDKKLWSFPFLPLAPCDFAAADQRMELAAARR